jgi:hypothetical protein
MSLYNNAEPLDNRRLRESPSAGPAAAARPAAPGKEVVVSGHRLAYYVIFKKAGRARATSQTIVLI